jgi:hypothetical protein
MGVGTAVPVGVGVPVVVVVPVVDVPVVVVPVVPVMLVVLLEWLAEVEAPQPLIITIVATSASFNNDAVHCACRMWISFALPFSIRCKKTPAYG